MSSVTGQQSREKTSRRALGTGRRDGVPEEARSVAGHVESTRAALSEPWIGCGAATITSCSEGALDTIGVRLDRCYLARCLSPLLPIPTKAVCSCSREDARCASS